MLNKFHNASMFDTDSVFGREDARQHILSTDSELLPAEQGAQTGVESSFSFLIKKGIVTLGQGPPLQPSINCWASVPLCPASALAVLKPIYRHTHTPIQPSRR
jgi:hypothetical protein